MRCATATLAALAVILAGCSADSSEEGPSAGEQGPAGELQQAPAVYPGPVGVGEGALSVLAWPGYAEEGASDGAVDWVTPFEEATGCRVEVTLFGTSEEAIALLQSGDYDVVSASGDAALRLIEDGSVQPVNLDLVPNYRDVFPDLKELRHSTVDGRSYGVPHGRGANLLTWNKERAGDAVDSWSIMFEPDSPAAGAIGPYDSPIYIADAANYLMATDPALGITDPYALDQEQFDAAIALLEQQRPLVGEYWSDSLQQRTALESGALAATTAWPATVDALESGAFASIKPREGATGWSDTWMIATETPHINCAYLWMDWMLSPRVNAEAAEWAGEAPASARACELTADPDYCTKRHAADAAYWNDIRYWTTPTETCLDGRAEVRCVPYPEWAAAWSRLRG